MLFAKVSKLELKQHHGFCVMTQHAWAPSLHSPHCPMGLCGQGPWSVASCPGVGFADSKQGPQAEGVSP